MISIPKVQTTDRTINQLQENIITGVLQLQNQVNGQALPLNGGKILPNVSLSAGLNTINHGLKKVLTGWFLVRIRANAIVWDSQDGNKSANTTLILNASAPVVVDIFCF
jgi:hypothetical protein